MAQKIEGINTHTYNCRSRRFGPVVRMMGQLGNIFLSQKAGQIMEKDPLPFADMFFGEASFNQNTILYGNNIVSLMIGENRYYIFREELDNGIKFFPAATTAIPSSILKSAYLCFCETLRQHILQNIKEGREFEEISYSYKGCLQMSGIGEKIQPIYGRTRVKHMPLFFQTLKLDHPDIFQLPFADLGSGFGWPALLWAQLRETGAPITMFEIREELAKRSIESARRLRKFGLNLDNVTIKNADFLVEDLSPFGVLYAYTPFYFKGNGCWNLIFQSLKNCNWRGKYLIAFIAEGLEECATDNGFKHVYSNFGFHVFINPNHSVKHLL